MKRGVFWTTLGGVCVLVMVQASCAFFDDGYEEYFSEEELNNAVSDVPTRHITRNDEGESFELIVDIVSFGGFVERGYDDAPRGLYPERTSASLEPWPGGAESEVPLFSLISTAYASGSRNVGNSLDMVCDAKVIVRDAEEALRFERKFANVGCVYGRGYESPVLDGDFPPAHEFLSVSFDGYNDAGESVSFRAVAARIGDEPFALIDEPGTLYLRVRDEYIYQVPFE